MTIRAYRIVKAKHAGSAFSGLGAKRFGGRWNSPGTPMVYVAGSISLAMLEMLVHLGAGGLLMEYVSFEVTVDDALVMSVDMKDLPKNWRTSPPPVELQQIGDAWAADAGSVALEVPSAVVSGESNYLLNPAHPDYSKITIGPQQSLEFDPRLMGKL